MDSFFKGSAIAPLTAFAGGASGALAFITGVEGPSYRPVGAAMAILNTGQRVGSLSSGCIEADIALHAAEAEAQGAPKAVRYGKGSPFKDIQLPCGGGMDVLLVPAPDAAVLARASQTYAARQPFSLHINADTGALDLGPAGDTGWTGAVFRVRVVPEIAFCVFGKGPEASTFAALARSAGFPVTLLSPDDETLEVGAEAGCATRHLTSMTWPEGLAADDRTAVVLFFHDHEWEPPILSGALSSPAFYIGAQGSKAARHKRNLELADIGVAPGDLARIKGPIGLVRSARDPRTLAVSVLAEVLAEQPS